jgi:hypothetical protein
MNTRIQSFFGIIFVILLFIGCNNSGNQPQSNNLASDTAQNKINNKIDTPKTQNTYPNIPENKFDDLISKFVNKEKNTKEYNSWLEKIVVKEVDGDTTYVTKKCLAYINDVIDNAWGYEGSIDDNTLN